MKTVLYKTRRNRWLAGVLAGLADKFKFDLSLIRFLYILFTISSFGFGVVIYFSLASSVLTVPSFAALALQYFTKCVTSVTTLMISSSSVVR